MRGQEGGEVISIPEQFSVSGMDVLNHPVVGPAAAGGQNGWDGMGWDEMGLDGMKWDGMGWDGMGWGMRDGCAMYVSVWKEICVKFVYDISAKTSTCGSVCTC